MSKLAIKCMSGGIERVLIVINMIVQPRRRSHMLLIIVKFIGGQSRRPVYWLLHYKFLETDQIGCDLLLIM